MCSIAGAPKKTEVTKMLTVMKHRAPDGHKSISSDRYCIGMGRLAIIDLSSPNLYPYVEDDLILTFNGEIYNYIELRDNLKSLGYEFRTNSDTEVLLKSYKEWGFKCLEKFNGMFAFAIYDTKKEFIFFARDIAGEKPFYYSQKPFRFASEAKALNWDCKELPNAKFGIYDIVTESINIGTYWSPEKVEISKNDPEAQLQMLLYDSIRLRTRSDVPYGLYLSGGVDSTLISTFHKFDHTFNYEEDDGQKEDFLKQAKKIYYHLDYPVRTFSPYGLWCLARQARRKNVRVVLSGEGADELFGGYVRFLKPHFSYKARKKYPSYRGLFFDGKSVTEQGRDEFFGNMQELLRMGDRMASAWGVENRCPFLDPRIINFAFSLPDELKIQGLDMKVILNRILLKRKPDYVPIEKKGLYVPVNKWIGSKQKFEKDDYLKFQNEIQKR